MARAKSHIEHAAESAHANLEPIMRIGEVPALAQFDGTERDPSAVFVRLVSDISGPRVVVGNGPPIPLLTSDARVEMTRQVRAQSGANVIELALPSHADANLLVVVIDELSKTAPVRVLGARSGGLDRSSVVIADTPAWAAKIVRIEDGNQARDAIVAGVKMLTATCEPLHQAFASISRDSDVVTKLPFALAQCDCSATNPEAVATLAAMMLATAKIEIGWIEVRSVAKSATKLRATGTINDVVTALALIPAQTRRAGVEFE
ncbi:MAG: hypothetical protein ABI591_19510 [Kofleriaceae bacterium]